MIILASGSPRRRELLAQLNLDFKVQAWEIDETPLFHELPFVYVERLALQKAATALTHLGPEAVVIAADTSVAIDGQIFGKPATLDEALHMWQQLVGRTHEVWSGVAVGRQGAEPLSCTVKTLVTMATVDNATLMRYWHTGEPLGKSGGYALQGQAAAFIPKIEGSYTNVVGLPLAETLQLLIKVGAISQLF